MTISTLFFVGSAVAAVVIAGLRWRPPPARCRTIGRPDPPLHPPPNPRSEARATTGRRWVRLGRFRRPRRDAAEIAAWCDDLSAALRSGDALAVAIVGVEPPPAVDAAVGAVQRDLRRGATLGDAMRHTAPTDPDARFAWIIATAAADHGGPAAEPLDRAAGALRARHAERVERQTQSTTARMSARVMTALPLAMLALLAATSAPVRDAVTTPIGSTAIAGGIGLNLAGWLWMRRLLDRAVR